jgi:hypothetical protein
MKGSYYFLNFYLFYFKLICTFRGTLIVIIVFEGFIPTDSTAYFVSSRDLSRLISLKKLLIYRQWVVQ